MISDTYTVSHVVLTYRSAYTLVKKKKANKNTNKKVAMCLSYEVLVGKKVNVLVHQNRKVNKTFLNYLW